MCFRPAASNFTKKEPQYGCLPVSDYAQYFQYAATGGVLKKGVLKNFANVTGKHLCQALVQVFFFVENFVKVLRTNFLLNTTGRLFLY